MAIPTEKRKTLMIVVLIGTFLLGGIGIGLAYMISRAKQVTPEESKASQCCLCMWRDIDQGFLVASHEGYVGNDGLCTFGAAFAPIQGCPSVLKTDCTNFTCENNNYHATSNTSTCQTGCTGVTVGEPNPGSNAVFTVIYKLRYAVAPHDYYDAIRILFTYPSGGDVPVPIMANLNSNGEVVSQSEPNVVNVVSVTASTENNLPVKTYVVTYTVPWNRVLNNNNPGTYKVNFAAKEAGDTNWKSTNSACERTFIVEAQTPTCTITIRPNTGQGSITGTATGIINGVPARQLIGAQYTWRFDHACDGTLDAAESNGPTMTNVRFTYPTNGTSDTVTCGASVAAQNSGTENGRPWSWRANCTSSVTVSKPTQTAACGDGTCDTGETCETNENAQITCPNRTAMPSGKTCRADCTYCGDNIVNGTEECEPSMDQNCNADCTLSEDTEPSNFSVAITTTNTCVERVHPNNAITITITVRNNSTAADIVRSVSDTLPLGFTYNTGSSIINGVAAPSADVTVETSGSSQLITWINSASTATPKNWSIAAGGTLTVRFTASAGASAVTGSQLNRVTVTPADNPIPGQNTILVAQVCEQPDTGIFDHKASIILMGALLLALAGAAYYTGFGTDGVSRFLNLLGERKDDLVLKVSKPQKYMEKEIEKSALKKISQKVNGSSPGKKKKR